MEFWHKNELVWRFENFIAKNTKYRFDRILSVDLQSDRNNPLRGGTYIELPKFITVYVKLQNISSIWTGTVTSILFKKNS